MPRKATANTYMLNDTFRPILDRQVELFNYFTELGINVEYGYFTHHMVMGDTDYVTELYPIPVLTLGDICDIGIDIDHIFIETKLKRNAAIRYDYSRLGVTDIDVYGTGGDMADYYKGDLSAIGDAIANSSEEAVIIAMYFSNDVTINTIAAVVKLLRKGDFYIL